MIPLPADVTVGDRPERTADSGRIGRPGAAADAPPAARPAAGEEAAPSRASGGAHRHATGAGWARAGLDLSSSVSWRGGVASSADPPRTTPTPRGLPVRGVQEGVRP